MANAFALYTVVFLIHRERWLLLKRAPTRHFAPNRWTGVGGKVEAHEFGDLRASALRELYEETGLEAAVLEDLTLRRVVLHNRPDGPLTGLLYYTATVAEAYQLTSDEGSLQWLAPERLAELDIIETTARVLPELVRDVRQNLSEATSVALGLAHYQDGTLSRLRWQPEGNEDGH